MQAHNETFQVMKKQAMRYLYDIKSGMLKVCENELSLRKWPNSGCTAQLRTYEGSLLITAAFQMKNVKYILSSICNERQGQFEQVVVAFVVALE